MKISWKHLSQLVDLRNISAKEVANNLTLAGLEVESLEYIDTIQDTILSIDITANRQDLAGWAQIAIEVSATIGRPLIIKNQLDNITITPIYRGINVKLFSEAYAYYIQNTYLKKRNSVLSDNLRALGLNSTGSILDAVNFVNLKWGQLINIYKLEEVIDKEIKYLEFRENYEVNKETCAFKVIINNKELSRITEASIENSDHMSDILLVNYNFRKENESHYINACIEFLSLIKDKTSIDKKKHFLSIQYNRKNAKNHNKNEYRIQCTVQEINKLLGPTKIQGAEKLLSVETMSKITQSLYLQTKCMNDSMQILIPPVRQRDISNRADIAEEIARIYGFNNFYDVLPKFNKIRQKSKKTITKQQIRYVLRSMGLHEVVSYSFQTKEQENHNLNIVNPLSKEQKSLRGNIISGIMEAKKYNNNQGNCRLEAFEIGNVFNKSRRCQKYKESVHLSWMLGKNDFNKSNWQTPGTPLTWIQAKGHTEELFEKLNAQISWSTSAQNNLFTESLKKHIHPTKSIYIQLDGQAIGVLSKVNDNQYASDLSSYFTEIRLDKLMQSIRAINHLAYIYNHYSNYPKISRDFSITISKRIAIGSVNKAIIDMQKQENHRIESIVLLSEYYNNQQKKTICFRVNYRSKNKTLTGKEVKILDNMLQSRLTSILE